MTPLPLLRPRLASPLVLLALIGGAIAAGELWLRRQLPDKPANRPGRATQKRRRTTSRRTARARLRPA